MEDLSFSQIQQFCFRAFHTSHHFLELFCPSCWVRVWDGCFQRQGSSPAPISLPYRCFWRRKAEGEKGEREGEKGRRKAEPPCAGTDLHLSAWRQGEDRTARKGCAAPWVYLGDLTQAARAESHICCAEGHDKLSPSQEPMLCDTRVCYIPGLLWHNRLPLEADRTKPSFWAGFTPKSVFQVQGWNLLRSHKPSWKSVPQHLSNVLQLHKGQSFKAAARGCRKNLGCNRR